MSENEKEKSGEHPGGKFALSTIEMQAEPPSPAVRDALQVSEIMMRSGLFPDLASVANGAAKIMIGRAMGVSDVVALRHVRFVQGSIVLEAGLLSAAVRKSGRYDYRIEEHNEKTCTVVLSRKTAAGAWVDFPAETFTMQDAIRQQTGSMKPPGKGGKTMLELYPKRMLFARALGNAVTFHAPDLFEVGTVYTEGELDHLEVEVETFPEPARADGQAEPETVEADFSDPDDAGDVIDAEIVEREPEPTPNRGQTAAKQAPGGDDPPEPEASGQAQFCEQHGRFSGLFCESCEGDLFSGGSK